MSQYLGVIAALGSHEIRPVLAHSYAMAVAGDGEQEAAAGIFQRKGGGAKGEEAPQRRAGNLHPAQAGSADPAAFIPGNLPYPGALVAGEVGLGIGVEYGVTKVQGA